MGTVLGGASSPLSQAVLHVGSIRLHGTAAYMAILVALALVLGLLSRH